MRKSLALLIFMLLVGTFAFAQKKTTDKDKFKEIQHSDEYIYGIGRGSTMKEASQLALEDLMSKITTNVESSYDYLLTSVQNNDDLDTKIDAKSFVKTYSRMTLNNTKQLDLTDKKDKEITVVRYMTKADLNEMFRKRGEKVSEYVKIARRAVKNSEVGKALQYYYWALALLTSYPDGYSHTIEDDDFNKQYSHTWIPIQMRELLKKIDFTPTEVKEDRINDEKVITLNVTFDGKPANDLTFTCSDGDEDVKELFAVKNGKAVVYVPLSTKERKLVANINYTGKHEAAADPELADVIDAANFIRFKEAEVKFGREIGDIKVVIEPEYNNHNGNQNGSNQYNPYGSTTEPIAQQNRPRLNVPQPMEEADNDRAKSDKTKKSDKSKQDKQQPKQDKQTKSDNAKPDKKASQPDAKTKLYSYKGETTKGKPDGTGVMTFNKDGEFDGVKVEKGDYLEGDFFDGHIYIVNHYDKNGNLKRANIIKEM